MDIIFESKTTEPTEFVLPNGETVVNFGHIQIIAVDEIE
jgi:hypothetical protein